jgi:hypothetical protein
MKQVKCVGNCVKKVENYIKDEEEWLGMCEKFGKRG